MDAPMCRICNVKHWPREEHKFNGKGRGDRAPRGLAPGARAARAEAEATAEDQRKHTQRVAEGVRARANGAAGKAPRKKAGDKASTRHRGKKAPQDKKQRWDREAYNEWMRKYMRKRRKELKRERSEKTAH